VLLCTWLQTSCLGTCLIHYIVLGFTIFILFTNTSRWDSRLLVVFAYFCFRIVGVPPEIFPGIMSDRIFTLTIWLTRRLVAMLFWVLASCRLVSRWQRFGETYCPHFQDWNGDAGKWRDLQMLREWAQSVLPFCNPEDEDSYFRNVGVCRRVYTAPEPRRTTQSSSPTCKTSDLTVIWWTRACRSALSLPTDTLPCSPLFVQQELFPCRSRVDLWGCRVFSRLQDGKLSCALKQG
jgi:hypothetical protein